MFLNIFSDSISEPLLSGFAVLSTWMPLWGPLILLYIFWRMWVQYVRAEFIAKQETVLLEIKLPRRIDKSPLAMELVLNSLYQTFGEEHFIQKYWKGSVRPWFSLELVSIEGRVKFFIWMQKRSRDSVEHQIYGQYPDVEVHEASDYTQLTSYDNQDELHLWGSEFVLTKDDPYPIKTYVDYGLEKSPKEEYKIDPITSVLEFLGSVGRGEQVWFQIFVRAHKKEIRKPGTLFGKTDKWQDAVKQEIEKIRQESPPTESGFPTPLTKGQAETITALERSVSKVGFDVGIRGIYMADTTKEATFNPANIGGLLGSFKQYSSNNLNGFKPKNTTGFKYPWQDFRNIRTNRKKRFIFDAYQRRSYFHPPYQRTPFVLNSEELATIYHFPGEVATTPTFERIDSKKSEPPTDLPV